MRHTACDTSRVSRLKNRKIGITFEVMHRFEHKMKSLSNERKNKWAP